MLFTLPLILPRSLFDLISDKHDIPSQPLIFRLTYWERERDTDTFGCQGVRVGWKGAQWGWMDSKLERICVHKVVDFVECNQKNYALYIGWI